ncbi:MAG: hypothetical protein ACFFDF_07610 [Candidatus Odinarchaeota archaeon]
MPLIHDISYYLEPRGNGKYWPSIKLRVIDDIKNIISLIHEAFQNRNNWNPYNEETRINQ